MINKAKEFEEAAQQAMKEFEGFYPTAAPEGAKPEDEKPPEDQSKQDDTNTPEPPPANEEPAPENEWEKKYKDSLKGMNDAQRKASETVKAKEDAERRAADLEARLNEALENAKKAQLSAKAPEPADEDDGLEADLPEVTKIAKRQAMLAQRELKAELDEIKQWRKAELERISKETAERSSRTLEEQLLKVHPDYHQVVNSDEMTNWIENEAPPLYKKIFTGAIPFEAADAVEVVNAYKRTLSPAQRQAKPNTPSAAEMAAPVKTTTPIATRLKTEAPPTNEELDYFSHNLHRMKPAEIAEWNRRIDAM